MKNMKPQWQQDYENGVASGFDVIDVRQYYDDPASEKWSIEHVVKTPYLYQGNPVYGYGVVSKVDATHREANTVECWSGQRNLEDVLGSDYRSSDKILTNKDTGDAVSPNEAQAEIGKFITAASEYPHVFSYPEYKEARTPINQRLHLDPPDEAGYEEYLQSVEKQMLSRDVKFIGPNASVSGLDDMRMTMPSVQDMVEEQMSARPLPDIEDPGPGGPDSGYHY